MEPWNASGAGPDGELSKELRILHRYWQADVSK